MRVAGLHLDPRLDPAAGSRLSAIAEVVSGGLVRCEVVEGDDEILSALPSPPALVVVDAPLAIQNATGKRDAEALLAWCDIPAFPVSQRRIQALYGGARGVVLAARMTERGYETAETLPDLVFRQVLWERTRPAGGAPLDLRSYREAWLEIRPPAFRPGRRGLPRDAQVLAAVELLRDVLDLGAWTPDADRPAHVAAQLDAIACAYSGWRHATGSVSLEVGTPERGRLLIPADANLAARLAVNAERLRDEGTIGIPVPTGGW